MAMAEILGRVEALLNQAPNPYSPANNALYQLWRNQPEEYERVMAEQRTRFLVRDGKYYRMASVHVEMCGMGI